MDEISTVPSEENTYLRTYEWFVLLGFILGMIFLTVVTQRNAHRYEDLMPKTTEQSEVAVSIKGAVRFPGVYHLPEGTTIGDLLERAQPIEKANLSKINKNKKLKNGQKLRITQQRKKRIVKNKGLL